MSAIPDKQQLRADLEETRAAYHELLASLSEDDWRRKSGNPDLTVKELMWHMAWGLGWLARGVDAVNTGRGFNPPSFLLEPARRIAMHLVARQATPERAAQRYDEGHHSLLAKLEAMRDEQWERSVKQFGEVRDAIWYFREPVEHFEEHAADVRAVLSRA
jgi:hypothetical protein